MYKIGFYQIQDQEKNFYLTPLIFEFSPNHLPQLTTLLKQDLGTQFQILDFHPIPKLNQLDLGELIKHRQKVLDRRGEAVLIGLNTYILQILHTFNLQKVLPTAQTTSEVLQTLCPIHIKEELQSPTINGQTYPLQLLFLQDRIPTIQLQPPPPPQLLPALEEGIKYLYNRGNFLIALDLPSPLTNEYLQTLGKILLHMEEGKLLLSHPSPQHLQQIQQCPFLEITSKSKTPQGISLYPLELTASPSPQHPPKNNNSPHFPQPTRRQINKDNPEILIFTSLDLHLFPETFSPTIQPLIIKLLGSLNASNTQDFYELISQRLENGQKYFILDLQNLHYINSTGISAILKLHFQIQENQGQLCLIHSPTNVQQLLNTMGVHSILQLAENIEQAKKLFQKSK